MRRALDWLLRYVRSENGIKQLPDPTIVNALKPFRPKKALTLYRGLSVDKSVINKNGHVEPGLSSWTENKHVAKSFAGKDGTLLKLVAKPEQCLVDVNLASSESALEDTGFTMDDMSVLKPERFQLPEQEIILLPGTFKIKTSASVTAGAFKELAIEEMDRAEASAEISGEDVFKHFQDLHESANYNWEDEEAEDQKARIMARAPYHLESILLNRLRFGGLPVAKFFMNEDDELKVAKKYAEQTSEMPPIIVFPEGGLYRLIDGKHRAKGLFMKGETHIKAYVGTKTPVKAASQEWKKDFDLTCEIDGKKVTVTADHKTKTLPFQGKPLPLLGGLVEFEIRGENLYPVSTNVVEEFQRLGLATAMYALAEKETGLKVMPSDRQTGDAKKFWAQPDRSFGETVEAVIDHLDEPLLHGTNREFDLKDIKPSRGGHVGPGIYMTQEENTAHNFGERVIKARPKKVKILDMYRTDKDILEVAKHFGVEDEVKSARRLHGDGTKPFFLLQDVLLEKFNPEPRPIGIERQAFLIEKLKEMGFTGIRYEWNGEPTFSIFDASNLVEAHASYSQDVKSMRNVRRIKVQAEAPIDLPPAVQPVAEDDGQVPADKRPVVEGYLTKALRCDTFQDFQALLNEVLLEAQLTEDFRVSVAGLLNEHRVAEGYVAL